MKTRSCTMFESKTTSEWNWKCEKGRGCRKARRTHIKSLSLWTYLISWHLRG